MFFLIPVNVSAHLQLLEHILPFQIQASRFGNKKLTAISIDSP